LVLGRLQKLDLQKNHREGFALVAPTKWKTGNEFETVTRFCFINPDTTEQDIKDILATMV
jgi:hypothetical protein